MSTPSTPPKPKWSPGGAIRRTSTILSMGRSKTPSRASSEHESDSSSLKGVVATPPSPTPKSASPRSSLEQSPSSEDPSATPSKSRLARMGGALRRPSSLIPRRRTTSMASSSRDVVESTNPKTPSALRSSTESAPRSILTAEPEASITAAPHPIPTPSQPATEPHPTPAVERTVTPPPVIEPEPAAVTGSTEEPQELVVENEIVQEHPQPTLHEVTSATISESQAEQELVAPAVIEPVPAPISSEEIGTVSEAVEKTPTPPTTTLEPEVPVAEPMESAAPLEADTKPISPISVVEETVTPAPEVTTAAPVVASEAEPSSEVKEDEQPAVQPSPVEEVVASVATPEESTNQLHEVSSLNSSFEDLGASAKQLTEEVTPAVQDNSPTDESPVLVEEQQPLSPIPEEKEHSAVDATHVTAVVVEDSAPRSLPLDIPPPFIESAAPSPAVTQPLLPLEVQETSGMRQRNGSVAPTTRGDHHHAKGPEEYKSLLNRLLTSLFGLIKWWRSGHW